MNKITPEIIKAINSAVDKCGSLSQVAARTNVSHATLSRYISGKVRNIHPATWEQLLPVIADFLPPDYIHVYEPGHGVGRARLWTESEKSRKFEDAIQAFQVISKEGGVVLMYRGVHDVTLTVEVTSDNLQLLALMDKFSQEKMMQKLYLEFEKIFNSYAKQKNAAPLLKVSK